jgi:D-alanyl-lipoteichoic acid acyltransferase DltB (MBOAT superfamily)
LALMMGIRFPLNFNSPYKAVSLIDFWRRWHMTLSRFLRDYLYIPLGGGRRGETRRYANLMVTMLLGGLWHGASWNFLLWGALHGSGLAVNHVWRSVGGRSGITVPRRLAWLLTMFVVLIAWVPFRAETLTSSFAVWKGMFGLSGVLRSGSPNMREAIAWVVALSAIALCAPNTQAIMSWELGADAATRWKWQPSLLWALALGCLFGVAVAGSLTKTSYFLYFRF